MSGNCAEHQQEVLGEDKVAQGAGLCVPRACYATELNRTKMAMSLYTLQMQPTQTQKELCG